MTQKTNTDSNDWLKEIIQTTHEYLHYVETGAYYDADRQRLYDNRIQEAVEAIQSKVDEMVREARAKEIKRMSYELEELSDFAFVNYPDHELRRAIKDYWRKNSYRLADLSTNKKGGE